MSVEPKDQKATGTPTTAPQTFRGKVAEYLGGLRGLHLVPLGLLFGLNFVDEFDQWAFGVLTPEIQDAFDIGDTGIAVIRVLAGGLVWLAAPLVGFLGDRFNRVRISIIGAIVWGTLAFASGLVPATMVWLFGIVRFGTGAGKTVNEPVHTSLLSDYYPPSVRGRVFAVHRAANPMGAIFAPGVAGLIAWALGWRAAFLILAIPTILLVFFALRLREPVRGISEDREAAEEAAKEDPVPFDRAVRWLYSIPTLKRLYIGSFFSGAGFFSFQTLAALFLEEEFGLSALERGLMFSAGGVFSLVGFFVAGPFADWLQREKDYRAVTLFFGLVVALFGFMLIPYAAAPTIWLVFAIQMIVSFFSVMWLPPYLMIVGHVSPARIRTLGLSYAALFFALGTVGTVIAGMISDAHGERWGMAFGATVLGIAGLIHASAAKFANGDVERSMKVLDMEARLRKQRLEAGANSLLVVRELDVAYGQTQVLFDVDFDVQEGELVALLGTNGAGKSTLLKAISGLVHPMNGMVIFEGRDISHFEPEETAELGIIQMPGGKSVFPTLTIKENLDMAAWLYHRDEEHMREAMANVYEVFPILRDRRDQQAGSLSGGEQQMLSLAQAFIAKPRILMIDELSLGLAPTIVQQLLDIVRDIHEQGTTIILVEQSVNVALTIARHAYFMEKGEIRFDGSTEELLERTDILRSVFLEGAGAVVGDGKRDDPVGDGAKDEEEEEEKKPKGRKKRR